MAEPEVIAIRRFIVHLQQVVYMDISVEAKTAEEAIELASASDGIPGPMVYGAFGLADVDESGEWTAIAVSDINGNEVWSETRG